MFKWFDYAGAHNDYRGVNTSAFYDYTNYYRSRVVVEFVHNLIDLLSTRTDLKKEVLTIFIDTLVMEAVEIELLLILYRKFQKQIPFYYMLT